MAVLSDKLQNDYVGACIFYYIAWIRRLTFAKVSHIAMEMIAQIHQHEDRYY